MNRIFLYAAMALLLLQPAAYAGEEELKNEMRALKKEVSNLRTDIRKLTKLVERGLQAKPSRPPRPPRPTTGKTGITNDPFMGNADAPVVLVEFSDYECPFCGRFFRNTLSQIKKEYVDTGKLKYVFKDFPLAFHKKAPKASEAAHCAGEKGKFWEMHDLIYENQKQMDIPDLINHAQSLGLDVKEFEECLTNSRHAAGIQKDIAAGKASGVTGTPSFILGKLNKNGEVAGNVLRGAQPFASFKTAIDSLLKKVSAASRK